MRLPCRGLRLYVCLALMTIGAVFRLIVAHQALSTVYEDHHPARLQLLPGRKYLSYLPHSGFHNQRIAFENALVLSFALGRTLLAPPIHLADKPIRYLAFDTLARHHELASKAGLEHCIQVPSYMSRPLECLAYSTSSFIPWDWLVDLSTVEPILQLPNASQLWMREHFHLRDDEIFTLRDSLPYQYRFLDTGFNSSERDQRYLQHILLSQLASIHDPVLQIGTLFGTSRLRLKDSSNRAYQHTVRRSMRFANRNILAVADSISLALNDYFFSAHVRLRDGCFRSQADFTVKSVWENLLKNVLASSTPEPCRLEGGSSGRPSDCLKSSFLPAGQPMCRRPHRPHSVFDIPLYVATDVRKPQSHRGLHLLRQTFPCTFFLGDFPQETRNLYSLKGPYDGVSLQPFLLPFVDAMVAARASVFVGTQGSTFSRFVTNLWHSYHK